MFKKNNKLILLILILAIPQIALAAWWNPFSWFNNWSVFHREDKTQVLEDRIQELERKLENKATTTVSDSVLNLSTTTAKVETKTAVIKPKSETTQTPTKTPVVTTTKTVKTWTLPNGAVIDDAGNIISPPTNTNSISNTIDIKVGVKTLSSEEIYSAVSPSVVLITTPNAHGTGFIIDNGKYTVTNHHVIEKDKITGEIYKDVTIKSSSGASYQGVVLGSNKKIDLAIIFNGNITLPSVKLGMSDSGSLSIGSDVFAFGYPKSLVSAITFTKGTLSARQNNIDDYDTLLQMDAAINPGNSGGPLVNNRGEVIGVNSASLKNSEGINFAIPVDTLKNWIPALSQYGQSRVELYPIGSSISIKRSMMFSIDYNDILSCTILGFKDENLTLCNLYKNHNQDYKWNIIEDVPN